MCTLVYKWQCHCNNKLFGVQIDIGNVKDQSQLESIAENLQYLCLGYYFFDNENYAIYAVALLDTFFINEKTRMNPNLNYAQFVRGSQNHSSLGRGEGVISSRWYLFVYIWIIKS